jgi:hypothetical protein
MASFWMNNAGTWRRAANVWMNDAGTWRKARSIWINDAGTWRKIMSAMTATGPGSVTGSGGGLTAGVPVAVTTTSAAATVADGVPGYTYAWSYVSGEVAGINTPTASSTTFTRNRPVPAIGVVDTFDGIYRCTVTDSVGTTASFDLTATFIFSNFN